MKQIRHAERQISKYEHQNDSRQLTQQALESERMELAIAQLEAQYPAMNPESDHFDKALVNFALAEQKRLIREEGLTPSKALIKATTTVAERFSTPAQGTAAGLGKAAQDRKAAQVAKNLATQSAQPPSTKDVGLDSDKMGATKVPDVSKMTYEEFRALPESTKAKMRGDFL